QLPFDKCQSTIEVSQIKAFTLSVPPTVRVPLGQAQSPTAITNSGDIQAAFSSKITNNTCSNVRSIPSTSVEVHSPIYTLVTSRPVGFYSRLTSLLKLPAEDRKS